jgi:hypothetical protein
MWECIDVKPREYSMCPIVSLNARPVIRVTIAEIAAPVDRQLGVGEKFEC